MPGRHRVASSPDRHNGLPHMKRNMAYHYTESGLDNIWLENGFEIIETPYGKAVSIKDTNGLHKVISQWLISTRRPLNGAELRFIRLELDQTQKDLASFIGSTEQNVRRWEKARSKPIPGPADRLVRALLNEYINGDGSVRALVDRLVELSEISNSHPQAHLRLTRKWKLEAEAHAA